MLSDAFFDFTHLVKSPNANIPQLLEMLEDDLTHYSDKFFGYSPQVFPLLRKAGRRYAKGKLSWRALHAITIRLDICYMNLEDAEESLIEDLRAFVRAQPTIDLRTKVGKICRTNYAASKKRKHEEAHLQSAAEQGTAAVILNFPATGTPIEECRK